MRISDWSSDVCSSDLVERAGALNQALAARRRNDQLDQFVDHRVLDAGIVPARRLVCRRAAPIFTLLVPWRQRLRDVGDEHVEVARAQALDVLRGIDEARAHLDAEAPQVEEEGQQDPFLPLIDVEKLEAEAAAGLRKLGRASCRDRVSQYV